MFARSIVWTTAIGLLLVGPAGAADATATPAASPVGGVAPERSRDGGVLDGKITAVDFQRNVVTIDAGGRKVDVTVLPSTNIQGKDAGYHTITDLRPGMGVQIYTSQTGGRYTAQIIKLK